MPTPPEPESAEVALEGGHDSAEEHYREITSRHANRTREQHNEEERVEPSREPAIRDIHSQSSGQPQEILTVKSLRDNRYDLINVIAIPIEHLSMMMYGTYLQLERGSPKKRTHIPTLDAWLTIGNSGGGGTPDRAFPGPNEAGKMTVPMEKLHDLEVQFHNLDYMEVKVPAGAIRRYRKCLPESEGGLYRDTGHYVYQKDDPADGKSGPREYLTFYGVRSTPERDKENRTERQRLQGYRRPRTPPSPRENWFELNHPMGEFYDRRYSEWRD
ncbi:hypothetical protein CKAH01_08353 [Colletotrichum kahawae]|uniref:Uncharacterized protein n=1 Tax=Colletotrichum kahawae TaxID=34407 RepID=A0AAD9Y3J9_COLKA|nr:hypothetical protein CKAH01_08353 [Colletotrichum kahawae]